VERMIEKKEITNRDVRDMFNISNRAALDELLKLVDMKVIKKTGEGRSVKYVLM